MFLGLPGFIHGLNGRSRFCVSFEKRLVLWVQEVD